MEKESKVLKNETSTFYTVQVGNRVVTKVEGFGTNNELITFYGRNATKFVKEDFATKVASSLNGKVFKHTVHDIQTEEIEEVIINE